MKKIFLFTSILFLSLPLFAQINYPETPKIEVKDTLWGTIYKDDYRWLENLKDPKVVSWFKQQAQLTDSVMNTISGRNQLIREWQKLDSIQPSIYYGVSESSGRFFFQKRIPGEKVSKVYYRKSLNGEDILLFNPLTFIVGKTISVASTRPSYDGKKLLIAYTEQGSQISTLRIMDVDTKKLLPDVIPDTGGAGGWSYDNNYFLYTWIKSTDTTDPNSLLDQKVKLHKLGTDISDDIDFFSNASYPELNIDANVAPFVFLSSYSKDYIFAMETTVQRELKVYYAPIAQFYSGNIQWKLVCTQTDNLFDFQIFDDNIYALTYKNAENFKLIATSISNPDWDHPEIIAPERSMILEKISRSKNYILMNYTDGINSKIFKYNPKTKITSEIKMPLTGTIYLNVLDTKSNNFIVHITSWNKPVIQFLLNADTDEFSQSPFNLPSKFPNEYNDIVVEEVEVNGHDGVMIPLSIIHKKGIKKDGNNVCYMESYGAYGYSWRPNFDILLNSLVVKNVVVAIPHVRGGGEKGQEWYQGGFKTTKPNTWKDFISCAEYLIEQGFTKSNKLAGSGTSAGGILITRAITERPDLFAAAICNVGEANAMRGEFEPNGPANIPEFGTVKDSTETLALYEMDGLQHVKDAVKYPAVMCVAGWKDNSVSPWQPAKFAAAMQNTSNSKKPILLKVNYDNGHFTEDKEVTWANFADQYAFLMWQCGHPDFKVK